MIKAQSKKNIVYVASLFLVFALVAIADDEKNLLANQTPERQSSSITSLVSYYPLNFDSEIFSDSIEICEGVCSFVLRYGTSTILMKKNGSGAITDSQIFLGSVRIDDPSIPELDVHDLGIDLNADPVLMFGGRLYALRNDAVHSWTITELEVTAGSGEPGPTQNSLPKRNRHLLSYNGGVFETDPETCGAPFKSRTNMSCIETNTDDGEGIIYHVSWMECVVEVCEKGDETYQKTTNCERKSSSIPQSVVAGLWGDSAHNPCVSMPPF